MAVKPINTDHDFLGFGIATGLRQPVLPGDASPKSYVDGKAQASALDTAADRFLSPGAFGLGALGTTPLVADIDSVALASGLYRTSAGTNGLIVGWPISGAPAAGTLLVERWSADTVRQTYRPISSASTYHRACNGGTWTDWTAVSLAGHTQAAATITDFAAAADARADGRLQARGLGVMGLAVLVADVDDEALASGFYRTGGSTVGSVTGWPIAGVSAAGSLAVLPYGGATSGVRQVYRPIGKALSYERTWTGAAWSDWAHIAQSFASRAHWLTSDYAPPDGTLTLAGSHIYRRLASATTIQDKPGWEPAGPVCYTGQWGMASDDPGTTDRRADLQRAINWVAGRAGHRLIIEGKVGISTPLDMIGEWVECPGEIRLLPDFVPTAARVLTSTANQTTGSFGPNGVRYNPGGTGAELVPDDIALPATETWENPPSFAHCIRIGSDGGEGSRTRMHLRVDGFDYFGRACGSWRKTENAFPGAGRGSGTNGAVMAGDSFRCVEVPEPNTGIAGVLFEVGDILRARVNSPLTNPTSAQFAANWQVRKKAAVFRVEGHARPFTDITLQAVNADVVALVRGNSERLKLEVAGDSVHTILSERSWWNTDSDAPGDRGASPDNNLIFVRGSNFGQVYENDGNPVTQLNVEAQGQLDGYEAYPIELRGTRAIILRGTLRACKYGGILVSQNLASGAPNGQPADSTGVHFDNFVMLSMHGATYPVLDANRAGFLTGTLTLRGCPGGIYLGGVERVGLTVNVQDQVAGEVAIIGSDSPVRVVEGGLLTLNVETAGTGRKIKVVRATDLAIEVHGSPMPVEVASANVEGVEIVLPQAYFLAGLSCTPGRAKVRFRGLLTYAQLLDYPNGSAGMEAFAETSAGRLPVYYAGGWKRASLVVA